MKISENIGKHYKIKGAGEMGEEKKTLYTNVFNIEFNQYDFRVSLGLKKDTSSSGHLPEDYDLQVIATPLFVKELAMKMLQAVSAYEMNYMEIPYEEKQREVIEDANLKSEEQEND